MMNLPKINLPKMSLPYNNDEFNGYTFLDIVALSYFLSVQFSVFLEIKV